MKKITVCLIALAVAVSLCSADPASDIAKAGDAEWDTMVSEYKKSGKWTDTVSASVIANDFSGYDGKVMLFPSIDFGDFITDKNGTKYYWCGEKTNYNIYVIKYNDKIRDQLYRLNNALGNAGGKYEVLGRINDAYGWWGDVVEMEVVAMRIKGRACVKMENGEPVLVGEKFLNDWLGQKADTWTKGIPSDAKDVPSDLSAEDTAKWFLYFGSVKKDQHMWVKLCTVENDAVDGTGTMLAKGQSWWRMISKADRSYYFVRADSSRDTGTQKYFMYQIQVNGADAGVAKPMSVIREKNGTWKVTSF